MSITVYLAGRYSRLDELAGYAEEVRRAGIHVTSRWLLGNHHFPKGDAFTGPDAHELAREFAWEDLKDLDAADFLVAFTEAVGVAGGSRGGRHVELGYALGKGKRVIVCGPRENVFCHLPELGWAADWPAALLMLKDHAAYRDDSRRYTMKQLAQISGVPARTIRWYITIGLCPPARGRGPSLPYDWRHVEALERIAECKAEGRRLSEASR